MNQRLGLRLGGAAGVLCGVLWFAALSSAPDRLPRSDASARVLER